MAKNAATKVKTQPQLAQPKRFLKLDLGCGQSPKDGFEGVDWVNLSTVKYVQNLWKFPWQFDDNSCEELHASHVVEHIPSAWVSPDGKYKIVPDDPGDKLLFFAFFDECYRILAPNGRMTVIVPAGRSNRAFQDPTHERFLVEETFYYLNADFRKMNRLDHYNVKCHFGFSVTPTMQEDLSLHCEQVQRQKLYHMWNYVYDFHAYLVAIKPEAANGKA